MNKKINYKKNKTSSIKHYRCRVPSFSKLLMINFGTCVGLHNTQPTLLLLNTYYCLFIFFAFSLS